MRSSRGRFCPLFARPLQVPGEMCRCARPALALCKLSGASQAALELGNVPRSCRTRLLVCSVSRRLYIVVFRIRIAATDSPGLPVFSQLPDQLFLAGLVRARGYPHRLGTLMYVPGGHRFFGSITERFLSKQAGRIRVFLQKKF